MQRPVAGVAAGRGQRDGEPALGIGVVGAGVAEGAECVGPAAPDRGALFEEVGVEPVGFSLEFLEEVAHGVRGIVDGVDALSLGLLDELPGFPGAEVAVVGLGDEAFGDGVAFGEASHEPTCGGVVGHEVDAQCAGGGDEPGATAGGRIAEGARHVPVLAHRARN